MTVQERLDEISKLSGVSVDIIRRVMNAERESCLKSLKHGERATLIGRCTMVPNIKGRLGAGLGVSNYISVKVEVAKSIESELLNVSKFEEGEESQFLIEHPEVRVLQVGSLM